MNDTIILIIVVLALIVAFGLVNVILYYILKGKRKELELMEQEVARTEAEIKFLDKQIIENNKRIKFMDKQIHKNQQEILKNEQEWKRLVEMKRSGLDEQEWTG